RDCVKENIINFGMVKKIRAGNESGDGKMAKQVKLSISLSIFLNPIFLTIPLRCHLVYKLHADCLSTNVDLTTINHTNCHSGPGGGAGNHSNTNNTDFGNHTNPFSAGFGNLGSDNTHPDDNSLVESVQNTKTL
ncbi:hypothetical protein PSTT_00971, partial [Puccinia striiformis]